MVRFIDLRPADIACTRFAFWNTVFDRFVDIDGEQAWDTWAEFEEEWKTAVGDPGIERFRALVPLWVFLEAED